METFSLIQFIFDLILTAAIYSGPILLYRYAIRRRLVENNTAKKIAIGYAILSFVGMFGVLTALNTGDTPGGAWMLWSYVNYRVLSS